MCIKGHQSNTILYFFRNYYISNTYIKNINVSEDEVTEGIYRPKYGQKIQVMRKLWKEKHRYIYVCN